MLTVLYILTHKISLLSLDDLKETSEINLHGERKRCEIKNNEKTGLVYIQSFPATFN